MSIILFIFLIGISIIQANDNTLTTKDIVLGGAVVDNTTHAKQTAETQAIKAVTNAETLKVLEILQNPEKLQKVMGALSNERKASPNVQSWYVSVAQWIKRDNLLFAIKALLRILVILVIYTGLRRSINHFIGYYTKRISLLPNDKYNQNTAASFFKTVSPIIRSTVHWALLILASLLILSELNINIMPIIYSFGVIGLAISIGSQTLVKDLINGVMTLFEGNIAEGETVTVGAFKGEVESLSLRCIHLRHPTGELQTIPFSEVNSVINHSRDYAVANIEFSVSFQADLKQVEEALQAAYEQIKSDTYYASFIEGDLKKLGVKQMDDWNVKVYTSIRTVPDPSKAFLSEFYRLLVPELQKRNVLTEIIPFVPSEVVSSQ